MTVCDAAFHRRVFIACKWRMQQTLFGLLTSNSDYMYYCTSPHNNLNWFILAGVRGSIWVKPRQTSHSHSLIHFSVVRNLRFIVVQPNHCVKLSLHTAYTV